MFAFALRLSDEKRAIAAWGCGVKGGGDKVGGLIY